MAEVPNEGIHRYVTRRLVEIEREKADVLLQQALEVSKSGQITTARDITRQGLEFLDKAQLAELTAVEVGTKLDEAGVEETPISDAVKLILTDPSRSEIVDIFSDPDVRRSILSRVPRETLEGLLAGEVKVDTTPIDEETIGRKFELPRGERSIRAASLAFGLGDEEMSESWEGVVIGTYREKFSKIPEGDEQDRRSLLSQLDPLVRRSVNDFLTKITEDESEWKGTPNNYKELLRSAKGGTIVAKLTPEERQILGFRQAGYDEIVKRHTEPEPTLPRREAPDFVDLNAFEIRLFMRALEAVNETRGEFTLADIEDLTKAVYERQITANPERLPYLMEDLKRTADNIVAIIKVARELGGNSIPYYAANTGKKVAFLDNHPVLRFATPEKLGYPDGKPSKEKNIRTKATGKSAEESVAFALPELNEDQRVFVEDTVAGISEEMLQDPELMTIILRDVFSPYIIYGSASYHTAAVRGLNAFKRNNNPMRSMADVLNLSDEELQNMRGLGDKGIIALNTALKPLREALANRAQAVSSK